MSKERLTSLLCASMLGEKFIPLRIGGFSKPRCFTDQEISSFKYFNNENSWKIASLFCNEPISGDIELGLKKEELLF